MCVWACQCSILYVQAFVFSFLFPQAALACLWLCAALCVSLGMCLGAVYRGLFSSCRTALWDRFRLPCITAHRQLRNSYFWSCNKALWGVVWRKYLCKSSVCTHDISVHVSCVHESTWESSQAHLQMNFVFAGEQLVPSACVCSDSKVGLIQTEGRKLWIYLLLLKVASTFSSCPYPKMN